MDSELNRPTVSNEFSPKYWPELWKSYYLLKPEKIFLLLTKNCRKWKADSWETPSKASGYVLSVVTEPENPA